jgi:hypothetical protein
VSCCVSLSKSEGWLGVRVFGQGDWQRQKIKRGYWRMPISSPPRPTIWNCKQMQLVHQRRV